MSLTQQAMLCACLCGVLSGVADAQVYPSRPIRLVIPFSPGGATDVPGRLITKPLAVRFGQQIIVDSRPGGRAARSVRRLWRAHSPMATRCC